MTTEKIDPRRVAMWETINRYVVACGGDPTSTGNEARLHAVVEIEDVVTDAIAGGFYRMSAQAVKDRSSR